MVQQIEMEEITKRICVLSFSPSISIFLLKGGLPNPVVSKLQLC
jgi:hypothetical protein